MWRSESRSAIVGTAAIIVITTLLAVEGVSGTVLSGDSGFAPAFDGSDDWIELDAMPALKRSFTFEFWAWPCFSPNTFEVLTLHTSTGRTVIDLEFNHGTNGLDPGMRRCVRPPPPLAPLNAR